MFGSKGRREPREGRGATHYQMRQRMISIGDDYVIENHSGERMFRLDGRMEIEGPGGNRLAVAQAAMITPVRDRWAVKVEDGPKLRVQGNIVDHEYPIERDWAKVAEVSKRWFRVRDTYGAGGSRRGRPPDPGRYHGHRHDGPFRQIAQQRGHWRGARITRNGTGSGFGGAGDVTWLT